MHSMNQEWISMNQDGRICMVKCGKSSLPAMVHCGKLHEWRCMYVQLKRLMFIDMSVCQRAISWAFADDRPFGMSFFSFFCFSGGYFLVASWLPFVTLDQAWKSSIMERRHRMQRRFEDVFFCLSVFSCVCVCSVFLLLEKEPLSNKRTLNTPWEHEQIVICRQ